VWSTGGCSSWYLDEHGRNVTLWPRTTYKFRQLTSRFDSENYSAWPAPAGTSTTPSTDRKVSA
jgi:cyclohexanone monooxygenase